MPSSSLQALVVRAAASLERGRGTDAVQLLAPALRSSALTRDEELTLRSMLAEAALLQDDLDQAASALGRPPDSFRDTVPPRQLATLWRLHGRLASARGDQSRAIAMHGRALKQADASHDSRSIGLAHYELGQCYRQVGDVAIVREHISKRPRRCTRQAIGAISHWSTRSRASRWRSWGAPTKRWRRCARPSASPRSSTPTMCSRPSAATRRT